MLLQQRPQVGDEGAAAPHDHLQQQRLAFLERHTAIAPYRLVAPCLRQAEVVHRVSGFVHRAQQPRKRIGAVEARGDADVARHALGEWVLALVDAAAIEWKSDRPHHLDHQRALLAGRKLAAERQRRPLRLQRQRLANQARQPPRQRLENRVDVGGGDTGRKLVHQRVVRRQAQRLSQQRRLVAHQVHYLLQMRREQIEIILPPGLGPMHLGARSGPCQARDQRHRSSDGVVALAAHFVQIGQLPVLQPLRVRLRPIQQPGNFGRGQQRMVFGLQCRQLLTAHIGAAPGHHHSRVPSQQRQRTMESVQPPPLLLQLRVRGGGHQWLGGQLAAHQPNHRHQRGQSDAMKPTAIDTASRTRSVR